MARASPLVQDIKAAPLLVWCTSRQEGHTHHFLTRTASTSARNSRQRLGVATLATLHQQQCQAHSLEVHAAHDHAAEPMRHVWCLLCPARTTLCLAGNVRRIILTRGPILGKEPHPHVQSVTQKVSVSPSGCKTAALARTHCCCAGRRGGRALSAQQAALPHAAPHVALTPWLRAGACPPAGARGCWRGTAHSAHGTVCPPGSRPAPGAPSPAAEHIGHLMTHPPNPGLPPARASAASASIHPDCWQGACALRQTTNQGLSKGRLRANAMLTRTWKTSYTKPSAVVVTAAVVICVAQHSAAEGFAPCSPVEQQSPGVCMHTSLQGASGRMLETRRQD